MLNVAYDPFLTRKTPFFTLFILSRASDNTASQNIGGINPPQILGDHPPVPPRSTPLIIFILAICNLSLNVFCHRDYLNKRIWMNCVSLTNLVFLSCLPMHISCLFSYVCLCILSSYANLVSLANFVSIRQSLMRKQSFAMPPASSIQKSLMHILKKYQCRPSYHYQSRLSLKHGLRLW